MRRVHTLNLFPLGYQICSAFLIHLFLFLSFSLLFVWLSTIEHVATIYGSTLPLCAQSLSDVLALKDIGIVTIIP